MTREETYEAMATRNRQIDRNNATRQTLGGLFAAGAVTEEAYEELLAGLDVLITPILSEQRAALDGLESEQSATGGGWNGD